METPQPSPEMPVKTNRTSLLIAAIAIVLCCFCVVVAVVGFYSYFTIRRVETQVIPVEKVTPSIPDEITPPSSDSPLATPGFDPGVGEPPAGGLGNDILRKDTWQYVAFAAMGQGCDNPMADDSTIEVLQEPDANGIWLEKWTVTCQSGDSYAYEVEYILDATGATFNIKALP